MIKPTLEEVKAYIKEKQLNVDAVIFYNYYDVQDWKDSQGKPVRNWKGKMWAVWHSKHPKTIQAETIKREQELAKEKRQREIGDRNFDELFREQVKKVLKPAIEPTRKPANQQIQELRQAEAREKLNPKIVLTPEQLAEQKNKIQSQLQLLKAGGL